MKKIIHENNINPYLLLYLLLVIIIIFISVKCSYSSFIFSAVKKLLELFISLV